MVFVSTAPQWYVVYEDMALCFLEFLRFHFLLQEVALLLTKVCKVVESVINRMLIGFVLSAIKDDEACVAPTEGAVGLAPWLVEQGG